ncbi:MAG: hypothetical protein M0042_05195 [Nitrospiraceae bacterium]|nr:hypothetical protein [Nitrospiraceae bacterium]
MNKTMILIVVVAAASFLPSALPSSSMTQIVLAVEDWRAEFDDICGKTDNAFALTRDELKSLVERCDKLKPRIEQQDESTAKVYLRRLKMCRDLFQFMLEQPQK